MQHSWFRYTVSLFALVLVAASTGRASEIHFSWQTTITPSSILADQAGGASFNFIGLGGASKYTGGYGWNLEHAVGATYSPIALANEHATYTDKPFTLALKLTDGPSGLSDFLTFHGLVNGGGGFALPVISFSDSARSIPLGQDIYNIQVLSIGLNGLGPDPDTNIFANISVSTASNTPEPSSLLLAAMALAMLGLARWKKPTLLFRAIR